MGISVSASRKGVRGLVCPPGGYVLHYGNGAIEPAFGLRSVAFFIARSTRECPMSLPALGAIASPDTPTGQALLGALARLWQGRHIVGLIEEPQGHLDRCAPGTLVSLADGRRWPIYQQLGCGAKGCVLDSAMLVEAAHDLAGQVAGADLVVVSKFGKLEAEHGAGMIEPMAAALEAGVPVLTSFVPRFAASWAAFAGDLAQILPPELEAVRGWADGLWPASALAPLRIAPCA